LAKSGRPFDASNVKAADAGSLFHAANLSNVLAVERKHLGPDAKFSSVVVYPGYLSLTQVTGGSTSDVYIDANGKYEVLSTGGNPSSFSAFSLTHITGDMPAAIAQRIATRAHFPLSQLHYMILSGTPDSRHFTWQVYPVGGSTIEYFQTSGPHGHLLELAKNSSAGLTEVR
jgi:hypothetical protein